MEVLVIAASSFRHGPDPGDRPNWTKMQTQRNQIVKMPSDLALDSTSGGDLASTWVVKLEVHAELQITRKTDCKLLVANDDNYALAA